MGNVRAQFANENYQNALNLQNQLLGGDLGMLGQTNNAQLQNWINGNQTSRMQPSPWGTIGQLAGAGIGGFFGGPAGASIGGSLGGKLGGAAGGGGGNWSNGGGYQGYSDYNPWGQDQTPMFMPGGGH